MEMHQDVKLNSKEQKLEWILLALALVFISLIVIGVISQSKGVSFDHILVPAFFFFGGLFFLLFGLNGITKGQLTDKWTPYILSAWTKAIIKVFTLSNKKNQTNDWKITLGIASFLVGIVCTTIAVYHLYKSA